MKKKSVYYFLGDTYSRDLLPFLQSSQKNIILEDYLSDQTEWVLLSPTVDKKADFFLKELKPCHKVALLMDWNFYGFDDHTSLVSTGRINLALSPFPVKKCRWIQIPSPHAAMMKERVKFELKLNKEDFFFCSQPLREDRPALGFDQFDLIRKVLKIAEEKNVSVYLKRHPRETSECPKDIKYSKRLFIWDGTLEVALGRFTQWYGYNTIALFDARELGHQVTFMR